MQFIVATAGTTCGFCGITTYHDVRALIDQHNGDIRLELPIPIPSGWDRVERITPEWGLANGEKVEERIRCTACSVARRGEGDDWKQIED
jgi:hypothetical protein